MENLRLPVDGEMVFYTLGKEWNHVGEVRPAMVVRVWSASTVNLLVFLDGDNDKFIGTDNWQSVPGFILWKTSILYAEQGRQTGWHRADVIPELAEV